MSSLKVGTSNDRKANSIIIPNTKRTFKNMSQAYRGGDCTKKVIYHFIKCDERGEGSKQSVVSFKKKIQ